MFRDIDRQVPKDAGFISLMALKTGALAVGAVTIVGGLVGGALGVVHNLPSAVGAELNTRITDEGLGVLTSVYTLPPKTCFAAYTNDVLGVTARAEIDAHVLSIDLPTEDVFWWEVERDGNVTTEVCVTDVPGQKTQDLDTGEVIIELSNESFEVINYATPSNDPDNPMVRSYSNDHSYGNVFSSIVDSVIKGASDGSLGIDGIYSRLANLTDAEAYKISAEACGQEAWEYLRPLLEAALIDHEIGSIQDHDPNSNITKEDITVHLPDSVDFSNQYSSPSDDTSGTFDSFTESNINRSPSPDSITCTVAPGLAEQLNAINPVTSSDGELG